MPKIVKPSIGPRLAVSAIASLAALASLFLTGDGLLRIQFDQAFSSKAAPQNYLASQQPQAIQPTIAGSEDYWLGDIRRSKTTPASWNHHRQIEVGDRITLTLMGDERELEVISVQVAPPGLLNATGTNVGSNASPLIVTLRTFGTNDRPIHLMLEGERELDGIVRVSERPHEL